MAYGSCAPRESEVGQLTRRCNHHFGWKINHYMVRHNEDYEQTKPYEFSEVYKRPQKLSNDKALAIRKGTKRENPEFRTNPNPTP